jgi:hypothetical protein
VRADKPAKPPAGANKKPPAPDVHGTVKEVSPDEKTITVVLSPKVKGEQPKTFTLKLATSTKVLFWGVGPGQAKVARGYHVAAWLAEKSKDTPQRIVFSGPKGKAPAVSGEVTAVASDGKSFTVHVPPGKKNQEGKDVEVKIADNTRIVFNNVGPGGARITKGYQAQAVLDQESKDVAELVIFSGVEK